MSLTASIVTALVLAGFVGISGPSGDDAGAYLTEKDGHKVLKAPLTLREEQAGIAGTTGTVWTVEPSGNWKVARFLSNPGGKEQLTPLRSGTMAPSQLEALAKALSAGDLAGLPAKAGREPKVNPHRVTIQFGQKAATLEGLPTRRGPSSLADHIRNAAPANEQASELWERFAHLVRAVETHCPEPKRP
jgi:hypothetical protein